jgi:two-component system, OmpR family, sensor histidine kinase CiaH
MFQKARIKLTAWYLTIIMLVSIIFSLVIYSGINRELGRFERSQDLRLRAEHDLSLPPPLPRGINSQVVAEARMRLTLTLILINIGIFGVAGLAGYFLAGRTLRPIKDMIDDQNRFITDASHELRTPITSLKTSIEVNLRNKNITLDQAKKLLKSNLEDVESLKILSDGLIRLAYYQKPNGNTIFEKVLVRDVVNSAMDKMKAIALEHKIKINSKIEDLKIEGDRKSLVELITILLDNAIKYSGKGSLIKISAKKMNDKAVIAVSDKGIGISEKELPHIFERFYRAEKSRSKEINGYGLGLSIAKKIVQMHGGTIEATSEKNHGTTLTICFKLALS